MSDRLRWFIARRMNGLAGQCWARLVDWAMRSDVAGPWPWQKQGPMCRKGADTLGSCYCGKVRR